MGDKEKSCPKCGFTGSIKDYFGFRKRPQPKAQSYCKLCRAGRTSKTEQWSSLDIAEMAANPLRALYIECYPGDKAGAMRSLNFMRAKLLKKYRREGR